MFLSSFKSLCLDGTSMLNKIIATGRLSALCDVANLTLCDVTNACESDRFSEKGVEINSFFENRDKCFWYPENSAVFLLNWLISNSASFRYLLLETFRWKIYEKFFLLFCCSEIDQKIFASRRHCRFGRLPNW